MAGCVGWLCWQAVLAGCAGWQRQGPGPVLTAIAKNLEPKSRVKYVVS